MTAFLVFAVLLAPLQDGGKKGNKKKPPTVPTVPPDPNAIEKINPRDRFEGGIIDKRAGWFLWLEKDVWHLRSGSDNKKSTFSAVVRVKNGKFKSHVKMGFEKKGGSDQFAVNADKTEMRFTLTTHGKADGVNFEVEGDEAIVEFDLAVNGNKSPERIAVGMNKRHPKQNPFRLPNNPPEREKSGAPKKKKAG
jgi:hypothetical protein